VNAWGWLCAAAIGIEMAAAAWWLTDDQDAAAILFILVGTLLARGLLGVARGRGETPAAGLLRRVAGACVAAIGVEVALAGVWLVHGHGGTTALVDPAVFLLTLVLFGWAATGGFRRLGAAWRASRTGHDRALARGFCAAIAGAEIFVATWWLISGDGGDASLLALAGLTIGVNLSIWGGAGGLRWLDERMATRRALRHDTPQVAARRLTTGDVAVLIPAHNEELVIRHSIDSAARLLPLRDIYVASDASTDATATIAREAGASVLELPRNKGKAGALEAAIDHFQLTDRYEAVLFLDADSKLDERYLVGALRFFEDPSIAAVAGYATIMWRPDELSVIGQVIAAYRDRLYTLQQRLLKFGQTWLRFNVTYIAPGFASAYRSHALRKIDMNPPGLIIEDFNMTFQLHRKRVGKIGFSPRVRAAAQDPATLGDYVRQVRRWCLGFWQTVRFNGIWPSRFWLALSLVIIESLIASVAFLAAIVIALGLALPLITGGAVLGWEPYADTYTVVVGYTTLQMLALALLGPDYVLTTVMAAARRRPRYLLLGLAFPLLRLVDAFLALWTLPLAWITRSTGSWRSPARR
jgi:biofilm PGA synthesis N-glycosyltransferase PgaC